MFESFFLVFNFEIRYIRINQYILKFIVYILGFLSINSALQSQSYSVEDVYNIIPISKDSALVMINTLLSDKLSNEDRYQSYFIRGYLKKNQSDLKGALWDYLECKRFFDLSQNQDSDYRSKLYNNIARIYEAFSNYELAIKYYSLSTDITNNGNLLKRIYYNIGNAYNWNGEYLKSFKSYQKALEYSNNDPDQTAKINSMIGVVNYNAGNFTKAEEYLNKVVNQLGSIDTIHIARAYHRLGTNYALKGDTTSAISNFESALAFKSGKDRFATLIDLSEIYLEVGKYDKVIALCNDAEIYLSHFNTEALTAKIYKYRADANFYQGNISTYKKEIDKYQAFNDRLNGLNKEVAIEGEKEAVATITRMHEEAIAEKEQQERNMWLGSVALFLLILCSWLAFREYKSQVKKKQISGELKKLNQQYIPRL